MIGNMDKTVKQVCQELQEKGLTYSQIGRLQIPPVSRQRVHQILTGYETGKTYVKLLVRNRSNKKCFICNEVMTLQVHHIDGNSKNNVEDNLVALCRRCHIKVDVLRKAWDKTNGK